MNLDRAVLGDEVVFIAAILTLELPSAVSLFESAICFKVKV